eukprot:s2624_g8.t1
MVEKGDLQTSPLKDDFTGVSQHQIAPPRRKPLRAPPTLSAGERTHGRARNLATKCGAASLYIAYLRHGPPARDSPPASAIRLRLICIKHARRRPNGQINSRAWTKERCVPSNSVRFGPVQLTF